MIPDVMKLSDTDFRKKIKGNLYESVVPVNPHKTDFSKEEFNNQMARMTSSVDIFSWPALSLPKRLMNKVAMVADMEVIYALVQ